MGWSILATQFCLELSFGVLLALAFVPKAPVGVLFYWVMGTSAFVLAFAGLGAAIGTGLLAWTDPIVLAAAPAIVLFPLYAGPLRGAKWAVPLGLAILGSAAAVVLALRVGREALSPVALALASSTALVTGLVAGSVGLAMVLGHWYLTVPNLPIRHLQRLNRVTIGAMLLSLVFMGLSCVVFDDLLTSGDSSLFAATGLFHLGTRVAVGLLFPLGFAAMAASSLRFQNTRSATGILYASTVLVLIGTAVSLSLQDSYGVPL